MSVRGEADPAAGPAPEPAAGAAEAGAAEAGAAEASVPVAGQRPLPMLPGFREIALRRMAGERRRLVAELAAQRQSAGLSQTQVAARMGTSQSAVARIEAGEADVRASTLERYAAAVGSHLSWRLQAGMPDQPAGGSGGSR
jgi:DNA-binding XRE family transcriptional regulator